MSEKKVLVIGELNVDILLNDIQGFPEVGKEKLAHKLNIELGSSSAIFASNLSALDIQVSFCGTVGNDSNAKFLIENLQKNGVKTDFIHQLEDNATGITLIMNYGQDRANITYCGAMAKLNYDLIPWENISEFDHVHISNFFIQKGIRTEINQIFKKLKSYGVSTSLDMQWDVEDKWDYNFKEGLQYVDVFLPNETEILKLTKSKDISEAVNKIGPYHGYLVIKRGTKGSMAIHKDMISQCEAFKPPNFIDAIGAGDSYNAGFLSKFLDSASIEECLEMGNRMGAFNTTAAGGTKAFGTEELRIKLNQL